MTETKISAEPERVHLRTSHRDGRFEVLHRYKIKDTVSLSIFGTREGQRNKRGDNRSGRERPEKIRRLRDDGSSCPSGHLEGNQTGLERPFRHMVNTVLIPPVADIVLILTFFNDHGLPWPSQSNDQREP